MRNSVSRRSAVAGGLAMLVFAAAASDQAKAEELDGNLMALCREFIFLNEECNRLGQLEDRLPPGDPKRQEFWVQSGLMVKRIHELRDAISDIPSKTPEGVIAKARVAYADLVCEEEWPFDNSTWIAISVLQDVLGSAAHG